MRIRTLLGMAVLVAVPSLPAFAQVWNTGVYAVLERRSGHGRSRRVMYKPKVTGDDSPLSRKGCLILGKDWEFTLGLGGAAGVGYDFGVIRLDGAVYLCLYRHSRSVADRRK